MCCCKLWSWEKADEDLSGTQWQHGASLCTPCKQLSCTFKWCSQLQLIDFCLSASPLKGQIASQVCESYKTGTLNSHHKLVGSLYPCCCIWAGILKWKCLLKKWELNFQDILACVLSSWREMEDLKQPILKKRCHESCGRVLVSP